MDFQNRHIVVTGGTGALGSAVVAALLEAGAHCHVPYRNDEAAKRFAHAAHPRLRLHPHVELGDEKAIAGLFSAIPQLWASIHIAGGFAAAPVARTTKATLLAQLDTNLVSCFLCCAAAVNAIAKTGEGGRIVNVAARAALEWRSGAGMAAYTAAKAGVAALTIALSEEVAGQNILVNAVAPSIMDTPANRQAMPKANHAAWPTVEDVTQTILFLASPENKVTRGAVVPVYGKS